MTKARSLIIEKGVEMTKEYRDMSLADKCVVCGVYDAVHDTTRGRACPKCCGVFKLELVGDDMYNCHRCNAAKRENKLFNGLCEDCRSIEFAEFVLQKLESPSRMSSADILLFVDWVYEEGGKLGLLR